MKNLEYSDIEREGRMMIAKEWRQGDEEWLFNGYRVLENWLHISGTEFNTTELYVHVKMAKMVLFVKSILPQFKYSQSAIKINL